LWNGRLVTWRAATPGVPAGGVAAGGVPTGGDETGGDEDGPVGVEEGLAIGLPLADGEASGEFEPVRLLGWVQPATSKTNPAAHAAGIARVLNRVLSRWVSSYCSCGSSTSVFRTSS
jgi:hypothetical protein